MAARVSSPTRRAVGIALTVVVAVLVVAALASGSARPPGAATFPPANATAPPAGGLAQTTRSDVVRALAAHGLDAQDADQPYRPAEGATFAAAPRIVLRAILPSDPDHGWIVIYEFSTPAAAAAAANEQAQYVASGVGRVQFPTDARFVIRVVGSTAIFFSWSPANSTDARVQGIVDALDSLGQAVAVPG